MLKKFEVTILLICFLSTLPIIAVHAQQPAAVIYISPTGSDAKGNGSSTNPYATISHAVGVAPAGAILMIAPGTYTESVTVTKPLTLESESSQPTNTIINAAGDYNGVAITGADAN